MKKRVTALLVCLLGFISFTFAQPYVNPWVLEQSTGGNAVRGMYSVGSGVVWAVGDNGLVMKRNGVSWAPIDLGMASGEQIKYNFNCVQMQGVNGWIVGENKLDNSGILLRTTSNGGGWTVVTSMPTLPAGTAFKSVSFSGSTGYVACANGIVLKSNNDYGATWTRLLNGPINDPATNPNGVSINYQDVITRPTYPNQVWVIGDNCGVLAASTDGGQNGKR